MEEDGDDNATPHIWLGAETPFKGPNKWFGGGRLKARDSTTDQLPLRSSKTNQNVLFGIATPQIPIWATDPSTSSDPPKVDHLVHLREWTNHESPPYIAPLTRRESSTTHRGRESFTMHRGRNDNGGDPPDDEGDGDGDGDEEGYCR